MARDFTKNTANFVKINGVGAINSLLSGATRMAFHCTFNADSISTVATADNRLFNSLINSTGSAGLIVALRGASSNVLHMRARSTTADTLQSAEATTVITTGAWHHAGGVLDYGAGTIQPYYDGAAEGGGSVTFGASTYTAGTPATNLDGIGGPSGTVTEARQLDGRLAELALWIDTVPVAADFAAMADGFSPLMIARSGLVGYWRMNQAGVLDTVGTLNATITGSVPVADHPRIILPRRKSIITAPAVAPPGGLSIPVAMHHYRSMRAA